jgi:D-threonine aldolase
VPSSIAINSVVPAAQLARVHDRTVVDGVRVKWRAERLSDVSTPALVLDGRVFDDNLSRMAVRWPGVRLRPHVKAHKTPDLARQQAALGHVAFTCATPREVIGMAAAGLGDDLLLANETVDDQRLRAMAELPAPVTVAVDSSATIDAAASAGIRRVLIDVNVGLPRCGCHEDDAGRLADLARAKGLEVRGVMGYEGHAMAMPDRADRAAAVMRAMDKLAYAHERVGGDIRSAGGTVTWDMHDHTGVTELQAGSYALMDSYFAGFRTPFEPAVFVLGTVISVSRNHCVIDVGLKALGMDHGNPTIDSVHGDAEVWFCSDEHTTVKGLAAKVGDKVAVRPAHIDPTVSQHESWIVVDRRSTQHPADAKITDVWPITLRGW